MAIYLVFFGLAFLGPIVVPMVYWYVLKKRESPVYNKCMMIRRIWAVIFLLQIPKSFYKAYQLPHGSSVDVPEFLGNVIGGLIIALFLWKKWKKEEIETSDEVAQSEK